MLTHTGCEEGQKTVICAYFGGCDLLPTVIFDILTVFLKNFFYRYGMLRRGRKSMFPNDFERCWKFCVLAGCVDP